MIVYNPKNGENFQMVVRSMIGLVKHVNQAVTGKFKRRRLTVKPGDRFEDLVKKYEKKCTLSF